MLWNFRPYSDSELESIMLELLYRYKAENCLHLRQKITKRNSTNSFRVKWVYSNLFGVTNGNVLIPPQGPITTLSLLWFSASKLDAVFIEEFPKYFCRLPYIVERDFYWIFGSKLIGAVCTAPINSSFDYCQVL